MLKRVLSAVGLILIGLPALMLGGIPSFVVLAFLLTAAAWEYANLFAAAQYAPSRLALVGGTFFVIAARFFMPSLAAPVLGALVLLGLAIHIVAYERGRAEAPIDFAVGVTGLIYIGWLGSYILDLRALPNGMWWTFLVLPTIWLVDVGAFMVGVRYGTHKIAPRLSPKKSWEGYAGGVFAGILCGIFLAYAFSTWGPLDFAVWKGALLGLLLGALTPLGDLGESMIKRYAGMKDSGSLIPGHGGAFDRIDSWLWGAILGYYFILWLA